jgi:hypothetical protein
MSQPNYNNFGKIGQMHKCLNNDTCDKQMNGMVGSKATAMSLPVVHLQIIDELGMGSGILNLPMCLKESFNAIRIALGFHSGANIVIEAGQAQVSFILDDHVVKNHTTCHDVDKGFLVPKSGWATNNSKPCLQNTKSSLNVLASCFLSLGKFSFYSILGILDRLNKSCPIRIDAIG